MLNNFLKLREAQPDKLSIRDITGSIYINLSAYSSINEPNGWAY